MKKKVRKSEISPEILSLGERIQEIIAEKNLKTREVAHEANLDVENLRKYIKGKQEMKVSTMMRIVKALNVSASELLDINPKEK